MAARITGIVPLLFITLICVGIVEGGYLAFEYFILRSPVSKEVVSSASSEKASTGQMKQQRKRDYKIILRRNLFGPPPGKEKTPAASGLDYTETLESTSLNIVLMGTIGGTGGENRAIILDKKSRDQELYETGDAIQGAFIKEILRGKVVIAYNGKDEILDMSEAAKMRPAYKAANTAKRKARPTRVRRKRPVAVSPETGINEEFTNPELSPQGTPRRVRNRPRVIRPSRSIRQQ
jgi:type II secretory pathway component PulC